MPDVPFTVELKRDGSVNKSAVVRAAYDWLLRQGAVDQDAPLATRVHAVRALVHASGLASLEDGCQHWYMLYAHVLKQRRSRRIMLTTAERLAELDEQIRALVSERNRLAADQRAELRAQAEASLRRLVEAGISREELAKLVETLK